VIVLDTNVLSELMRHAPAPAVIDWFDRQSRAGLFTTSITRAEVFYGLGILPPSQRREHLTAQARKAFALFAGRILPFDDDAADAFAVIAAARRQAGRPISQSDAQIAAIAQSRGSALATRNIADFADCGLRLVDPWQSVTS